MANKKKRPLWMEEAAQKPTSGTPYANRRNEQEARNTSKQRAVQTVSKMTQRGTGSQTTSTGRSTANGVDILQRAQNALGVREPEPGSHGRIENTLGAAGNGWLSGQLNMIGSVLGSGVETNSGAGLSAKVREKEIKEYREKMLGGLRDKSFEAADKRAEKAEKHEKAAKEGLGGFGKLVVDTGIAGSQMLMDAALGSVTGTGLLSMGTRTYGDSARQAREAGASWDEANRYGLGKAGVEVGTEKMFDAMRLFGGGSLDKTMEATLNKMAKTDAGRTALRLLGNIGGEGAEEAVSDLVDPILRQTYDSDAIRSTYGTAKGREEMRSQILYDALVGGILGGLGGAGSVVTGENARKNDALRTPEEREAAERPQRIAEADAARERQDMLFGADAESVAAYQAQQNRPRTIAQGVEALQNAANAVNAQNAAESPVTNGTPQEGNLSANAERTATQDVTGQIRPQTENAARSFAPEDHIDNRTDDYISKTSTKAFQYEHPELHEHFAGIAQRIMEEAMVSIDRGSTKVTRKAGGGTRSYYDKGLKAVMERSGLSRNQVIKVCQDIINDRGSENYADAKRVEQALDSLMSEGGEYADAEYKRKKGEITGGTQAGSFDEYLKENELVLALGMATEDELRAEWEANQKRDVPTDTNGLPEGQGAASANFATTPENVDYNTWSENAAEVYPVGENARRDAQLPTENPQGQRTMRGGRGVMEWEGTPEFRAEQIGQLYADGNLAYEPTTNAELAQTAEQTVEQNGWLATYNDWSQRVGNNELSPELVATGAALLNGAGQSQQISTGDYLTLVSQYVELLHRAGQSLQAARVLKRLTPEARLFMMQRDIDAELDGHNMTDEQRQEARASTMDFAREWANMNMQGGNPAELVSLIRRLNAARMTGGLFTPRRMSGTMERTINSVLEQEGGYEFLYSLAGQQIHNLATDHAPRSGLEIAKSLRYMAMLSKLNTVMRNLVGNNVFDPIESLSTNIGILPDLLMSMFTHQRTTGFDSSWLSAAKRRGSAEGMQRAYLAAALDADPGEVTNRWEQSNRRTFRMDRSLLERFFSTIEKWQQYELYVTDEMQKGGVRAAAQDRIDRLTQRGLLQEGALDGWAEEQALQRTFQNEGTVAGMMEGARDLANGRGRFVLRDRNGGTLGVGDALVPFARVPGNVVGQFLNYTPAGLMRGMGELVNVLHRAHNGTLTAQQQAQAALDIGRGLNGTGLLIGLGALAARGLLNVADAGDDEDEKNLAKLRQSEGVTGTQWNLSATMRALNGGSEEWQDGDELMSIGFLEPLNGVMALAALMADDAEALEDSDVWGDAGITTSNTLEAAMQSIADLPAVTSLNNIVNAFRYSDAESFGGKAADAGVQLAGDFAGSFVPNALAGIAQGMDEGAVRQTRTSDRQGIPGTVENAWNNVLSKIPGVRSRLPQALDNWGQDRQTTATPLQNWFNTNVLPGAITRYQTNEVNQELYRLMESQDVKPPARSAIKEVSDGDKTRKLDNEDQRTYQEVSGQTAFRELQRLMDSAQYGRMRDDERAAAWNAIMTYGKAQGEQWVGGDRKTPSWATKSDGSTAENAAFYAILQAAKHRLDEDERQKVAPVVEAIFNRRLDEQTQLGVLQQELNEKQIGRLQTAIGYGYEPKDIAAFWGYMNSVNGRKGDTRSWALQNGFSAADFNVLWKVFH